MSKIENYLGIANHDIQMANNSQELKSYVASILCEIDELQQENQELKKQLEVGEEQYNDLVEEKEEIQEQLSSNTLQFENQQKEFIKWLEDKEKQFDIAGDPINSGACLGILRKYKEIIGVSNENNTYI